MADIVVDTHILVDIISQFNPEELPFRLNPSNCLKQDSVRILNELIFHEGDIGFIVASSMVIIEIINKFDEIVEDKFRIERLYGFIKQPPSWFLIEDIGKDLALELIEIPKFTRSGKNIENPDAIHVSTCSIRGPKTKLATNDENLIELCYPDISTV